MKRIITFCMILLAFSSVVKAQVSEQEFQALKAFYNATGGDNWTNRTGWENINTTATKDDVTTGWVGIEMIEDGHITEISFHNNNIGISGQLPPEIGNLVWLKSLEMGNNNITGTLPNEFGNLINLEGFTLVDNKISGPLPASMANLTKLRTIYFNNNPLNCPFPSEIISNWLGLYIFQVSTCGFTGELNLNFELFPDLYIFSVNENQLTGEIPLSINKLNKLYTLKLSRNQFEGNLPSLDSCKNIKTLSFSSNSFSGSVPLTYNNFLKTSISFNISNNNLSGPLPVNFMLNKTRTNYCYDNFFTFEALEPIVQKVNADYGNFQSGKLFPLKNKTVSINKGETLSLNAASLSVYNLGGNNNRYKWFKNNVEVYSGNSPIYTVASAGSTDAGNYRFEVTNTVVANITLKSDNITVSIVGSNQPPTNIALSNSSISENFTGNVGTLTTTDPDAGDTHTYSLATGNGTNDRDNGKFSITGNQLNINSEANFETSPSLNIFITVNDGNGGIFTQPFVITVNNLNEAPIYNGQLTSNTIDENAANGSTALTLLAQDPEGTPVVFSITAGNEDGAFGIDGNKLIVANNSKLNYDVKKQYNISVMASDGELNTTAILIISLNKINQVPQVQNAIFTINENVPAGTVVGSITATDRENNPLTFSILTGNELSGFRFNGNTLVVDNSNALNYENNQVFNLTINVSDGISNVQATVTINLNNIAESTDNDILSFSVPGMQGNAVINNTNHTVAITVSGVDRSALAATYTIPFGAVSNPVSGTVMNFSSPQTIRVTTQLGAIQDWVVSVAFRTANPNIETRSLSVYPNPARNFLVAEGIAPGDQLTVMTLRGQKILHKYAVSCKETIDIEQLQKGVYLLQVESSRGRELIRFARQ